MTKDKIVKFFNIFFILLNLVAMVIFRNVEISNWKIKVSFLIIVFFLIIELLIKILKKSRICVVLLIILDLLYLFAGWQLYKVNNFLNNIGNKTSVSDTNDTEIEEKNTSLKKAEEIKPFNILISGIDTRGTIKKTSRTDVNQILTVNPKTKKILITSIPRDYYVPLPFANNNMDKLTHTGIYGPEKTIDTIDEFMDIKIDYYIRVNFTTFTKFIDEIGGIDVDVDCNFKTNDINYHKGMNHLDGKEALAFVRERHSFKDGDFARNRNQSKMIEAVIDKVTENPALLFKYSKIMDIMEDNIEMSVPNEVVKRMISDELKQPGHWVVEKQNVIGNVAPQHMPCYSLGGARASVVLSDQNSIDMAGEKINQVINEEGNKDA